MEENNLKISLALYIRLEFSAKMLLLLDIMVKCLQENVIFQCLLTKTAK